MTTVSIPSRNLTIGDGTVFELRNFPEGVFSTADLRVEDIARPRTDGEIAGDDFRAGLTLGFEVQVRAGSLTASEQALVGDLRPGFAPSRTELELVISVTGAPTDYTFFGKPRGCASAPNRQRNLAGLLDARCLFRATDPIAYGPSSTVNITLVDPGVGLQFPVTFPIVFSGGGSGSGTGSAPNVGTTPVDWSAVLTGPLTNPRIALSGSGQFVQIAATIQSGQTVLVDSKDAAILLNGTSPRPQWFGTGSSWWQLQPGSNSVVFTADAGTGDCDFSWRSGWG